MGAIAILCSGVALLSPGEAPATASSAWGSALESQLRSFVAREVSLEALTAGANGMMYSWNLLWPSLEPLSEKICGENVPLMEPRLRELLASALDQGMTCEPSTCLGTTISGLELYVASTDVLPDRRAHAGPSRLEFFMISPADTLSDEDRQKILREHAWRSKPDTCVAGMLVEHQLDVRRFNPGLSQEAFEFLDQALRGSKEDGHEKGFAGFADGGYSVRIEEKEEAFLLHLQNEYESANEWGLSVDKESGVVGFEYEFFAFP